MSLVIQEVENIQNQHFWKDEEEQELEEALSLCDLPISKIATETKENEAKEERNDDILENDFDFGSLDGEMCAADEVFSGGQILPYRNSVSSMSGLRSVSRSDSMDRRGFGSSSSSSRSSSVRSHYSAASSSGSSTSCSSNNTGISAKTVPMVSKAKVQNQFHSYPSPKPQILGSGTRLPSYSSPLGKKSKMWEVLKLGLVRTPEIELQDLKLRHRTNNFGKTMIIPRNNSIGSSSSRCSNKIGDNNNIDRARKSCSNDGDIISDFVLEVKKKNQLLLPENKSDGNNSGFFKSCKCSVGAIEPMPSTRPNYGIKRGNFGSYHKLANNQKTSTANQSVLNEDKKLVQKNRIQLLEEQRNQQQQQRTNNHIRQGTQVTMTSHRDHHHHHHDGRTFEWLKNLSHASVLNDS